MTNYIDRWPEPMKDILIGIHDTLENLHENEIGSWTRPAHERQMIEELKATGFINYTNWKKLMDGDIYTSVRLTEQGKNVLRSAGIIKEPNSN